MAKNMTLQEMCEAADREADSRKNVKINGKWLECVSYQAHSMDSYPSFQFYYDDKKVDWTEAKVLLDSR